MVCQLNSHSLTLLSADSHSLHKNDYISNVDKVLSKKFKPSSHILDEYIYNNHSQFC